MSFSLTTVIGKWPVTTGRGLVPGWRRVRDCAYVFPMEVSTTLPPRFTPEANAKFTKEVPKWETSRKDPQPSTTLENFWFLYICFSHISPFLGLKKDVVSCLHRDLYASFLLHMFYSSTDVLPFLFISLVCLSNSLELWPLGLEHYLLVHRQVLASDFTQNRTNLHPTCLLLN